MEAGKARALGSKSGNSATPDLTSQLPGKKLSDTNDIFRVTNVTFTAPSSSYGRIVKTLQTSQRGYDNDHLS